ncbi:hypothetical protein WICPIJ_006060 [Wickerhamomyces pijperi]|uniref:Uncharacterized protein n=1 Tax=Wickerhamomyces pijperi TaxID=599730 RepID=A0A9P8Q2T8_WICPI|nr:hypothetical protein WICPIJ_006060 [Wickerhamomyces pijperi]
MHPEPIFTGQGDLRDILLTRDLTSGENLVHGVTVRITIDGLLDMIVEFVLDLGGQIFRESLIHRVDISSEINDKGLLNFLENGDVLFNQFKSFFLTTTS